MLKKYQKISKLDPFSEHQFDPDLQEIINAYPTPCLSCDFISEAGELNINGISDISTVMAKVGRFARAAPRGILGCPVYTLVWRPGKLIFRDDLFFVDHLGTDEVLAESWVVTRPLQTAGYDSSFAVLQAEEKFSRLAGGVLD